MNWQCVVTRAMASSMARPSRRRWAPTSMKGIGVESTRARWFIKEFKFSQRERTVQTAATRCGPLRRDAALAAGRPSRQRIAISRLATPCSPVTGGSVPLANRVDEGDQLGAQRLVVADRKMPHRIGAVGLEAEALRDLAGQQVAHHVLAARRDGDVARLERRQPVGVDVGEHARGGAELQQRDVLALGHRVGELRLHLDDLGFGEPADQIDVVHGEIDDDADIRHPRRERTDPGDGDGKDILAADRFLDRLHGRIEALDMADHQGDAGAAGGGDDVVALLDRGGDRLLDQDMDAALDAGQRDLAMQMGRRRDGDGIDAELEQALEIGDGRAAERARDEVALGAIGIDHAHQLDAGQSGEDARVVGAHGADADHADAQRRAILHGLHHVFAKCLRPAAKRGPWSPSTSPGRWRLQHAGGTNTF